MWQTGCNLTQANYFIKIKQKERYTKVQNTNNSCTQTIHTNKTKLNEPNDRNKPRQQAQWYRCGFIWKNIYTGKPHIAEVSWHACTLPFGRIITRKHYSHQSNILIYQLKLLKFYELVHFNILQVMYEAQKIYYL